MTRFKIFGKFPNTFPTGKLFHWPPFRSAAEPQSIVGKAALFSTTEVHYQDGLQLNQPASRTNGGSRIFGKGGSSVQLIAILGDLQP